MWGWARLLDSQSSAKLRSAIVAPGRLKFRSTPSTMKSTASPSFTKPRPASRLLNSVRLHFLSTCTSCSSPPSLLTRKRKESELSLVAAMVSSSAVCGTAAIGHLVNKFAGTNVLLQKLDISKSVTCKSLHLPYLRLQRILHRPGFELERLGS